MLNYLYEFFFGHKALQKKIKELEDRDNMAWRREKEAEQKVWELQIRVDMEFDRAKQIFAADMKRLEVEAVHLKQLVEEKNMVIDKLLSEKEKKNA